ncbi:unnamed protein product, partial [Mesorhabditis spiculigera]
MLSIFFILLPLIGAMEAETTTTEYGSLFNLQGLLAFKYEPTLPVKMLGIGLGSINKDKDCFDAIATETKLQIEKIAGLRQELVLFGIKHCGHEVLVGKRLLEAFNMIKEYVRGVLVKLTENARDDLVFQGHSLGGCLAQMFSLWAQEQKLWLPGRHFADAVKKENRVVGRVYQPPDAFMNYPQAAHVTYKDGVPQPAIGFHHAGGVALVFVQNR